MKQKVLVILIGLLAVAGVALCVFLVQDNDRSSAETAKPTSPSDGQDPPRKPATVKPKTPRSRLPAHTNAVQRIRSRVPVAEEASYVLEFAPADQKTVDALQDALDSEDFKKVAAQLKDAAASTNVAVRAKAVEALQWFGEKALSELTQFMADEDEGVRTSAIDAWTMGLSQMEAGEEKARAVRMGLSVVTDRGQLELMVMQVDDLTDFQKLSVLTQVIEGDNKPAAAVAREHYKFWTEEDYTDLAAAQKWLDDRTAL